MELGGDLVTAGSLMGDFGLFGSLKWSDGVLGSTPELDRTGEDGGKAKDSATTSSSRVAVSPKLSGSSARKVV